MTRLISLIALLLLLPAASVLGGDLPQVLQPNTTAYSVSELAALTQEIATLTEALNDYNMASRRYFSASDWSSSDFATYTAGVLSEKGYETVLVSGSGWSDGVHTWALVGISLGTQTAWVPVEATPEAGQSQQVLARIPSVTDTAGNLVFDAPYGTFTTLVQLPSNVAPVGKIRLPNIESVAGNTVTLLAVGSYDPDGSVVLFKWQFGDGKGEVTPSSSVLHKFSEKGDYTITLTVIDNRGATMTTIITLFVTTAQIEPRDPPSGNGCGCG